MPIRNFVRLACPVLLGLSSAVMTSPGWSCEVGQDVCLEVEGDAVPLSQPDESAERSRPDNTGAIEQLADAITADLKARRLTRPPGNNAIERIEQMQTLAPEHDYAINGRRYVVDIYLNLARWQWRRDKRDAAMRLLASARALEPGSAAVERTASQLLASDAAQPEPVDGPLASSQTPAPKPQDEAAAAADSRPPASQPVANQPTEQPSTTGAATGENQVNTPVEPTQVWRQDGDARYPQMVAIPAGSFEMGGRLPVELPRHQVQLSAFSLSRHEVTVAQYRRYALDAGVKMPEIASDRDSMPVTGVNWHDAAGYAAWLASKTGHAYRLPSEAEWEYAARASTTTPFFSGETLQGANCVGCDVADHAEPLPVGSYAANDFGLFDTHGNVWEWVLDCWRENYRHANGEGAAYIRDNCERRVLRGGSWYNTAEFARSAYRGREVSGFRDGGVGFRVAHDGL